MRSKRSKRSKSWLAVFLLLAAGCTSVAPKTELKLMSYNIRYINAPGDEGEFAWDARKASSIEMIHREAPDVIGFQEPKRPQLDYLVEHLPEYGHVEMGRDCGVKPDGGEHLMVMYLKEKYDLLDWGHFWLSDTPEKASHGWDAMCRRVTVWVKLRDKKTDREFFYFDTHLDHKGKTARLEGAAMNVRMMLQIAGDKAPVFISGDMNAAFGAPTESFLAPYVQWLDVARDKAPESDNRATFNGFGKEKPLWIDHIFYRNALPVRYETLDGANYGVRYISDHYPIVCTFNF